MATSLTPAASAYLDRLDAAVSVLQDAERVAEDNRKVVYGIIREIVGIDGNGKVVYRDGVKQADIVRSTDWTREHIRNIASGKVGK